MTSEAAGNLGRIAVAGGVLLLVVGCGSTEDQEEGAALGSGGATEGFEGAPPGVDPTERWVAVVARETDGSPSDELHDRRAEMAPRLPRGVEAGVAPLACFEGLADVDDAQGYGLVLLAKEEDAIHEGLATIDAEDADAVEVVDHCID